MNRILTYTITEQDIPGTIQSFLQNKNYSSQVIKELKKMPESILIDGKWEYMRHELSAGETLTVHIKEGESSEKIPPIAMDLDIVYEDEDIVVINKPANMPIHPSLNNYYNSLANGLMWYYEHQGIPFTFRCINRLDRDTSGLTIVAKHMLSAGILSTMVTKREIHREYLAITAGRVTPASGTINAPIARVSDSIIERHVDFEKGERAVTHYTLKEYKNGYSLLSIHLETGRTHQIRVHMKHIGFPLAGDSLYNPEAACVEMTGSETTCAETTCAGDAGSKHTSTSKDIHTNLTRQALHSHRLTFRHPITGAELDFIAPMPKDMCSLLIE